MAWIDEQLVARGIRDPRVLEAMRRVPRELFVPEASLALAYADRALPIGSGQTISQPYMVAAMTEALLLEGGERRELEERRAGIEQAGKPIAHRQLALRAVTLEVFRAAALACPRDARAQFVDELLQAIAIAVENRVGGIDVGLERVHADQWSDRVGSKSEVESAGNDFTRDLANFWL